MMAANDDLVGLIRLVLTDIDEQEFSPPPHPLFKRLIDVAVLRPEILVVVLFRVRWSPALLADLLLHPATSALACWLISKWPGSSGAWDRELTARDDRITKAMAFGDAVVLRAIRTGFDFCGGSGVFFCWAFSIRRRSPCSAMRRRTMH